jgi:hypothetical protein
MYLLFQDKATAGAEFLTWANHEEMEAVKAVTLFLSLSYIIARNDSEINKSGVVNIHMHDLHQNFPEFGKRHWPQNKLMSSIVGECPAVRLYDRRREDYFSTGTISIMLFLMELPPPPLPTEMAHAALAKASEIGLLPNNTSTNSFMESVRVTLEKILGKPIEFRTYMT